MGAREGAEAPAANAAELEPAALFPPRGGVDGRKARWQTFAPFPPPPPPPTVDCNLITSRSVRLPKNNNDLYRFAVPSDESWNALQIILTSLLCSLHFLTFYGMLAEKSRWHISAEVSVLWGRALR